MADRRGGGVGEWKRDEGRSKGIIRREMREGWKEEGVGEGKNGGIEGWRVRGRKKRRNGSRGLVLQREER